MLLSVRGIVRETQIKIRFTCHNCGPLDTTITFSFLLSGSLWSVVYFQILNGVQQVQCHVAANNDNFFHDVVKRFETLKSNLEHMICTSLSSIIHFRHFFPYMIALKTDIPNMIIS